MHENESRSVIGWNFSVDKVPAHADAARLLRLQNEGSLPRTRSDQRVQRATPVDVDEEGAHEAREERNVWLQRERRLTDRCRRSGTVFSGRGESLIDPSAPSKSDRSDR